MSLISDNLSFVTISKMETVGFSVFETIKQENI